MHDQAQAAAELVERARSGDQNAMGMIVSIREAKEKGSPKAATAFTQLERYIKAHPVTSSTMGEECPLRRCVALANGPLLTKDRIKNLAASFGNEKKEKLFTFGVVHFRNPDVIDDIAGRLPRARPILEMGRVVGAARNIQAVRMPNIPLSQFSASIAWELGE